MDRLTSGAVGAMHRLLPTDEPGGPEVCCLLNFLLGTDETNHGALASKLPTGVASFVFRRRYHNEPRRIGNLGAAYLLNVHWCGRLKTRKSREL
jgi:hypothetical protein